MEIRKNKPNRELVGSSIQRFGSAPFRAKVENSPTQLTPGKALWSRIAAWSNAVSRASDRDDIQKSRSIRQQKTPLRPAKLALFKKFSIFIVAMAEIRAI
jgi:hypothetical protein